MAILEKKLKVFKYTVSSDNSKSLFGENKTKRKISDPLAMANERTMKNKRMLSLN